MMDRERMAMKNAEASVRMEGYRITPKMREQCQRVLSGKITVPQLLKQYKQKRENAQWVMSLTRFKITATPAQRF